MPSDKLPILSLTNFKKPVQLSPDFYIKTFQEHKLEHPFIMKPHRHDFYMIMLFTKGKGNHTIDFTSYEIKKGSMFFMSPAEMHSWDLSEDTNGYVLVFNSSFFIMNAQNRSLNEFPFFSLENKMNFGKLKIDETKHIELLLKSIYAESRAEIKQQSLILRAYLDILLLKLTSIFGNKKVNSKNAIASLIPKLENLIELNYNKHLPVTFYANELLISSAQLTSLTTNFLGISVNDLIQDRLVLEAKRLLVYTNLTVSEISYHLNFSDNSNFNKFFKKRIDLTPEQFRKQFG